MDDARAGTDLGIDTFFQVVVQVVEGDLKIRGVDDGDRLFEVSYTTFGWWFQRVLFAMGFAENTFRSHSLRRGGATALSLAMTPFTNIQMFGRWASEQSCRMYIKKGELSLLRLRAEVGQERWRHIETIANIGERAWALFA